MSATGPSGSGGSGGSGLSPFTGTPPPHAPMPAIPTPPLGAGAAMHAAPLPGPAVSAGAAFVPPVAVPAVAAAAAAPARNVLGLRPGVDDALTEMRTHAALAPHSGALMQDQHRNKPVKGYADQAPAHDALRASALGFRDQAAAAAPPSVLSAAVHMASSQLHVSLPGPELQAALDHGFPALAQPGGNGNLRTPAAAGALSSDIHERREHAKANVFDAAALLSPASLAQVALPSPRRESMAHGGGYIVPPPQALPPVALPLPSDDAQRQIARSLMTPLAEPEWTAPVRGAGVAAAPHHGAAVNQARDAFMLQAPHMGEVGRDATAQYLAGAEPTHAQIRVGADPSATLHPGVGAGAHEVVPTDLAPTIAAMPAHVRPQMAYAQADVRTSTALTFLRGGPAGGGGGGAAAAAAAAAPGPAAGAGAAPDPAPTKGTKRKKPGG